MYETTVAEGVRLLDTHEPGWESQVDLASLDMFSPHYCMLGQVFGSFGVGVSALGIEWGDTAETGFIISDGVPEMFRRDAYDRLGETWREIVMERRQMFLDELADITQELVAEEEGQRVLVTV